MSDFLFVAGVFVFAFALRSFAHPLIRKLGAIGLMVASFMFGYVVGHGSIALGCIAVATWFFLPWLDLLTRIRGLRLPLDKKLKQRRAPSPDAFPHLRAFTSDVKQEGFEYINDAGWEWDDMTQFVRFFYDAESKVQATISLKQQSHIAFAYLSVSSRTEDGKVWTTWNYPFSYPMKSSPEREVNRIRHAGSFAEMVEMHHLFLASRGIDKTTLQPADPEELDALMERELRDEIDHNLDRGLIKLSGHGTFRYSWRGLLFLWGQAIKDMIRLA
jgi:hypothetical protein